jgi:hypothetical protein
MLYLRTFCKAFAQGSFVAVVRTGTAAGTGKVAVIVGTGALPRRRLFFRTRYKKEKNQRVNGEIGFVHNSILGYKKIVKILYIPAMETLILCVYL